MPTFRLPRDLQQTNEFIINQLFRLGIIYSAYRIVISLLFILVSAATIKNPLVGGESPSFHFAVLTGYFIASISLFIIFYLQKKSRQLQLFIGLVIDATVLSLMLYATGGPNLQLSMLYLVVVAASYMLLPSYQAILITLLAVIYVTYQQFFFALANQMSFRNLGGATLLSVSFIGVALVSWLISKRLKDMEYITRKQAQEVMSLNQLNQQVIGHLQNGILVINHKFEAIFFNQAAENLLNLTKNPLAKSLEITHPALVDNISQAIFNRLPEIFFNPATVSRINEPISLSIHTLSSEYYLLIIESMSKSQTQAQQLKLASLGQLTASIAHEIRNPLAAISQASQLLLEDSDNPDMPDTNRGLYDMIYKQTVRVNRIIEDILQLSRQPVSDQVVICISEWLPHFIDEHFPQAQINTHIQPDLWIAFAPYQLEQVLVNLIQNGLRYSAKTQETPSIDILIGQHDTHVSIEVMDNGPGITTEFQEKLFEPFFTTENQGTGLGLYISKALCEANGAKLNYIPNAHCTCFRITALLQISLHQTQATTKNHNKTKAMDLVLPNVKPSNNLKRRKTDFD